MSSLLSSVCAGTLASNMPGTLLSGAFTPAVDLSWMLLPQVPVWLSPHLPQVHLRRHLLSETYPNHTKNFEIHDPLAIQITLHF